MVWTRPETAVENLEREAEVFDHMAAHARTIFSIGITLAALAGAVLTFVANGGNDVTQFVNTEFFGLAGGTWVVTIGANVAILMYVYWDAILSRRIANNINKNKRVPRNYQVLGNSEILLIGYFLIPGLYIGLTISLVAFIGSVIEYFADYRSAEVTVGFFTIYMVAIASLVFLFWTIGHERHISRWFGQVVQVMKEIGRDIRRFISER